MLIFELGNAVMNLHSSRINPGSNSFNIDASNLSNGTYFIQINIDGRIETLPLVVVK